MQPKTTALHKSGSIIQYILGGLIIVAILYFYWPVLSALFKSVIRNEDSSYGLILPLVSAYIVYRKWPQIRQCGWQPSWLGPVILIMGFGIFIFGELFQSLYIPSLSFVIVLAGLAALAGGRQLLRILAFPIFLLILMIPYEGFFAKITLPLQIISSQLAAWLLAALGKIVFVQGNIIDLGDRQLNIVEACSGLRYIVNLVSLGVIFCYFFQRRLWKVIILLLTLIPYAIFGNAVRIASIGLFPFLEKGVWHMSIGLSIFLVGFDYLKLVNWILNNISYDKITIIDQYHSTIDSFSLPVTNQKSFIPYFFGTLIIILIMGPLAFSAADVPPITLLQDFKYFPMQLGTFQGRHVPLDDVFLKKFPFKDYLNAEYTNPGHGGISLWIAYNEYQKWGEATFHSPYGCYTGVGWQIVDSTTLNISGKYPVNRILMKRGDDQIIVFYWHLRGGRWVIGDYSNKFAMAKSILLNRRSDGAVFLLSTSVIGKDVESAQNYLISFAELLIPLLPQFIPD